MTATEKSNSNKDYMLRVRMENSTLKKLDEICKVNRVGRSEMVRRLIEKEFEEIKK